MKVKAILILLFSPVVLSAQSDSLDIKIGQMIMMGLPSNVMDTGSQFYKDVQQGRIGGISLYERLLTPTSSAENLKQLVSFYQQAAPIPLYVAITQEGGLVNRLKPKYGFPQMPSAQYLGTVNKTDSTKYYADNIAYTLSRVGININFAPVVDIYMESNPVLGSRERTFSADTRLITTHAATVIRSHKYFNVRTALKHFPGHGSSTEDSHLEMTDVSRTWKRPELEPYKELMKRGLVESIMTAHIVNAQLDPSKLPATLSKKIITGLLRQQLGFKGVVFSDDMHMKAIAAEYDLKDAIVLAINAGVDVLLFSGNTSDIKSGSALVGIIRQLVNEKRIAPQIINAAYARIMKMKKDM
jgi:beta-N-acetylhexosaminidase